MKVKNHGYDVEHLNIMVHKLNCTISTGGNETHDSNDNK